MTDIATVSNAEATASAVEAARRGEGVAVLVPCYNEAPTIARVVADFRAALPEATIYVYDNNSTDGTADIAAAAGAVVRRESRQGKGNVVRQMLRDACYLEKRTRSATAAAIGRGYMKERPFAITHSDGRREMDHYGCLTPKGLAMCARRFCGQAALPGMG